jgi:hypothetical protein
VKDTVIASLELNLPERTIGLVGTQVWVRASALSEHGEMLYSSSAAIGPDGSIQY